MWRVEREGSGLTEGCLVSVDDLQNHVEHFGEEELGELNEDAVRTITAPYKFSMALLISTVLLGTWY